VLLGDVCECLRSALKNPSGSLVTGLGIPVNLC
jgi:hypothetical protein